MVNWPCLACGMHYNMYLITEVTSAISLVGFLGGLLDAFIVIIFYYYLPLGK